MILLLDNYDSFTHNLYQYLKELTDDAIRVVRNDRITIEEIEALRPERIVISPGPGRPEEAGVSVDTIRTFTGQIPILGVCLGHQALAYAFGGTIVGAKRIVHGKVEDISLDGRGLFRSIASPAPFTRYHSLVVEADSVPEELEVTAWSGDGEIMGLRHREHPVEGVQFHPESIASEAGKRLLSNFLRYRREPFVVNTSLSKVLTDGSLNRDEAANFMEELTDGNLTPAQISGFLVAMNARGITPEEIAGCASVLQRKRTPIAVEQPVLDTCGTGGDGLGTFNISSFTAIVAAAAGVPVAKHGNRAVSSRSGSADFYTALGIDVNLTPDAATELLNRNDFAFLFAPIYHQAMRHAAVPRKELGIKTIMNLLGPLVNPAGASYQLIGVFDAKMCRVVAEAAHLLGIKRALVVHGADGLDEISISAPTTGVLVDETGSLSEMTITPESLGLPAYQLSDIAGGSAEENAAMAWEMLDGASGRTRRAGLRDAVCVNAGAALWVAQRADSLEDGLGKARDAFEAGSVRAKLEQTIELSRELGGRG